jgi:hypothetical protein
MYVVKCPRLLESLSLGVYSQATSDKGWQGRDLRVYVVGSSMLQYTVINHYSILPHTHQSCTVLNEISIHVKFK